MVTHDKSLVQNGKHRARPKRSKYNIFMNTLLKVVKLDQKQGNYYLEVWILVPLWSQGALLLNGVIFSNLQGCLTSHW